MPVESVEDLAQVVCFVCNLLSNVYPASRCVSYEAQVETRGRSTNGCVNVTLRRYGARAIGRWQDPES